MGRHRQTRTEYHNNARGNGVHGKYAKPPCVKRCVSFIYTHIPNISLERGKESGMIAMLNRPIRFRRSTSLRKQARGKKK